MKFIALCTETHGKVEMMPLMGNASAALICASGRRPVFFLVLTHSVEPAL